MWVVFRNCKRKNCLDLSDQPYTQHRPPYSLFSHYLIALDSVKGNPFLVARKKNGQTNLDPLTKIQHLPKTNNTRVKQGPLFRPNSDNVRFLLKNMRVDNPLQTLLFGGLGDTMHFCERSHMFYANSKPKNRVGDRISRRTFLIKHILKLEVKAITVSFEKAQNHLLSYYRAS